MATRLIGKHQPIIRPSNEALRMRTPRRPLGIGLLIGVLAVIAATLVRFALDPFIGPAAPFAVYLIAVLAASFLGGFRPGVLATALGGATGFFLFLNPRGEFTGSPTSWINLASYALLGVGISFVSELWQRSAVGEYARKTELENLVGNLRVREESQRGARKIAEE